MEVIDQQYVRRFRQHIPFYKSEYPQDDRRVYWHHKRKLCDPNCIWGIPVVQDQYLMFVIEDNSPTGIQINPFASVSKNTTIELCCIEDDDASDCPNLNLVSVQDQTLIENKQCILDGQPYQFNYLRIKFPDDTNCGLHYLKIIAYEGTANERIFYSQPIYVYPSLDITRKCLVKLNINDDCSVGGIKWSEVWAGWPFIDGYEVYLPEDSAAAFVEEITDEEVEEDGRGNEIQVFEKVDIRYQFDTGYVPEYYMEFIKEITRTSNNAISIPDTDQVHYFKISRAESDVFSDGDGCYVNLNMKFTINSASQGSCCDTDACECPQDENLTAISYTTNQDDAELSPSVGDTYIVPNLGPAPNNPDWKTQDNNIAVWNGTGWDYFPNTVGLYYLIQDTSDYWISRANNDIWLQGDAHILSIVEVGGGSCQITVVGLIPYIAWAKIQISPAGLGTWTDIDSVYYDYADWLAGKVFSIPLAGNYDFRLVHLNIGCGLDNSPIFNKVTTETCV